MLYRILYSLPERFSGTHVARQIAFNQPASKWVFAQGGKVVEVFQGVVNCINKLFWRQTADAINRPQSTRSGFQRESPRLPDLDFWT